MLGALATRKRTTMRQKGHQEWGAGVPLWHKSKASTGQGRWGSLRIRCGGPHNLYTSLLNKRSKLIIVPPPQAAQIWPNSDQVWSNSGQMWSLPGQVWPNLVNLASDEAEFGPISCEGPTLVEIGRLPRIHGHLADFGEFAWHLFRSATVIKQCSV